MHECCACVGGPLCGIIYYKEHFEVSSYNRTNGQPKVNVRGIASSPSHPQIFICKISLMSDLSLVSLYICIELLGESGRQLRLWNQYPLDDTLWDFCFSHTVVSFLATLRACLNPAPGGGIIEQWRRQ